MIPHWSRHGSMVRERLRSPTQPAKPPSRCDRSRGGLLDRNEGRGAPPGGTSAGPRRSRAQGRRGPGGARAPDAASRRAAAARCRAQRGGPGRQGPPQGRPGLDRRPARRHARVLRAAARRLGGARGVVGARAGELVAGAVALPASAVPSTPGSPARAPVVGGPATARGLTQPAAGFRHGDGRGHGGRAGAHGLRGREGDVGDPQRQPTPTFMPAASTNGTLPRQSSWHRQRACSPVVWTAARSSTTRTTFSCLTWSSVGPSSPTNTRVRQRARHRLRRPMRSVDRDRGRRQGRQGLQP